MFSSIIGVVNQALKIARSKTGMNFHSFLFKNLNTYMQASLATEIDQESGISDRQIKSPLIWLVEKY